MQVKEIIKLFEEYAPGTLQEEYDNSGLNIGDPEKETTGALCTLDVNEEVVDEAKEKGLNLIISHHPLIFQGIKRLSGKNEQERAIIKAIKYDIGIYSVHTNLDNVQNGVNGVIAEKLGLKNTKILSPKKNSLSKFVAFIPVEYTAKVKEALFAAGAGHIGNYDCCSYNLEGTGTFRGNEHSNAFVGEKYEVHHENEIRVETIVPNHLISRVIAALKQAHPYEEPAYDVYPLLNTESNIGSGLIGEFDEGLQPLDFLALLKETFHIEAIRYSGNVNQKIQRVALCGGSGSFLIKKAISSNAHAFITSDIKYHQFFDAESSLLLADIGHYESEQYTKEFFYHFLSKKIPKFAVHLSDVETNPIKYYY